MKTWNANVKWLSDACVKVELAKESHLKVLEKRRLEPDVAAAVKKLKWSHGVMATETEQKYWHVMKDGRVVRSMRIRDPISKWKVNVQDP